MNSQSNRDPLERLAEEFVSRYRVGERPAVSEYAQRHPELADEVRAVFPALVMMEDLALSSEGSGSTPVAFDGSLDAEAPEQLGDFRIVREIGRGGMGVVYEAEQLCLQRRVAVKVLPQSSLRGQNSRTRFLREAQSAAKLHHTNIVPVFGVGEQNGLHYYAMQYIEGRGLDRVLQEMSGETERNRLWVKRASLISGISRAVDAGQPLHGDESAGQSDAVSSETATGRLAETTIEPRPDVRVPAESTTIRDEKHPQTRYWDSVARIGMQVSDALEHSHAHGILHRDIKPGNLLLDGQGTVWVTDFGLARSVDEVESVTATGEVVGTLRYSAPEQIEGNVDGRSDVYSLGLTLYELLAMQPAFTERSRRRLADQVMRGDVLPLQKIDPDIPRDLATIVHKAIQRDPADRYQSAADLTADLRRFLDGEPIHARRVTMTEKVWRWCRRNPVVTWSVVGSVMAILVTLAIAIPVISSAKSKAELLAEKNSRLLDEALKNSEQLKNANKKETKAKWLAERRAQEKTAVFNYVVLDMINSGLPVQAKGQPVTLREMLERAANRAGARFAGQPAEEAAVRAAIGTVYYRLGEYEKARIQLASALDIRRKNFGTGDLETLKSMRNLAAALNRLGQYPEASVLGYEALARLQQSPEFGPQHKETFEVQNVLASSLINQGKYTEALSQLQDNYQQMRSVLGEKHRSTLYTMSNLAVTLHRLRRYQAAERINREALAIMQLPTVFGGGHPTTITTLGNLALNLSKQGRHADAVIYNRRVLRERRRLHGSDHPDTLTAITNLAENLIALHKPIDANRLYQEIYTRSKALAGPHHPSTLKAGNNLAWAVYSQGQTAEAKRIFKQLLSVAQRELGAEHPVCQTIERNLAKISESEQGSPPSKTAASRRSLRKPSVSGRNRKSNTLRKPAKTKK